MLKDNNKLEIQAELDSSSISALKNQIRNAITQSINEGIGERTMFLWLHYNAMQPTDGRNSHIK